jgi:curved DNA-binding protein CbpA
MSTGTPAGTPYEDPYAVLDLARTATPDEIKQAYFAQVRLHPPERDAERFKRIRASYDKLKSPDKRLEADMQLLEDLPALTALPAPELDLSIAAEDVLTVAKAGTDLTRRDFSADFRDVRL